MSWSDRAADDLLTRLQAIDLRNAPPAFGDVWSALVAWGSMSFAEASAPMRDEIELLWAWHEPAAQEGFSYFDAPEGLGEPLFALSVSRTSAEPTGHSSAIGRGGAGVDLFFEDGPLWVDALEGERGYLGRGGGHPALEYHVDSSHLAQLSDVEILRRALTRPVIGLSPSPAELVWRRPG